MDAVNRGGQERVWATRHGRISFAIVRSYLSWIERLAKNQKAGSSNLSGRTTFPYKMQVLEISTDESVLHFTLVLPLATGNACSKSTGHMC
jgi:hypothetical protein